MFNLDFAYKVSGWNRRRKYKLFVKAMQPSENDSILDVGYSNKEYSSTDNFLEKNYPYRKNITALGVEECDLFKSRYPEVNVVRYEGLKFPFAEKQFDICWSNAVIEHVGDYQAQVNFVKEISRCSNKSFFTTPNRYFPIETHTRLPFLHWLPKKYFDKILHLIGKGWAADQYMYLLGCRDLKGILEDAGVSNYVIHKNKLFGFTLDFVVLVGGD